MPGLFGPWTKFGLNRIEFIQYKDVALIAFFRGEPGFLSSHKRGRDSRDKVCCSGHFLESWTAEEPAIAHTQDAQCFELLPNRPKFRIIVIARPKKGALTV